MKKIAVVALAFASLFLVPTASISAATFQEDFSLDPATRGWESFGNAGLFHWDPTNEVLEVTWDSSQSNSYLHRPLGTILSRADDFSVAFDLVLSDVAIGTTSNKPYNFQISVSLLRLSDAIQPGFLRGTGSNSPNLVEFDYFPDSGFGATVSPTLISSSNEFASSFNFPLELATGDLFHVEMSYTAGDQTLTTTMTRNGAAFGPIEDAVIGAGFSDFRVDHLAISSYSDEGQIPEFAGSILAHGTIDNLVVTTPPPPVTGFAGGFSNSVWRAAFESQNGWTYRLERSFDFQNWTTVDGPIAGTGGGQVLLDEASPGQYAFYRIVADKP